MNANYIAPPTDRRHQQGVALVVVLILLIVITVLGFAAIRGTVIMQRISGNFYDRSIAFQAAEAALQSAAALLQSGTTPDRVCAAGGGVCSANPFDTASGGFTGTPHTVPTSGVGAFTMASNATQGQPQYIIEDMGAWVDPSSNTNCNQTANAYQYGSNCTSPTVEYYRITARSGDPKVIGDRAVVTLQAMYKQ